MVDMSIFQFLNFIIVGAYWVLGGWGLLSLRRPSLPFPMKSGGGRKALIVLVVVFQAFLIHWQMFPEGHLNLSLGVSLLMVSWVTVVMYSLVAVRIPMGILESWVLLVAGILSLAPIVFVGDQPEPNSGSGLFKIHLVLSLIAYGLYGLATVHAILMAILEKRLHDGFELPHWGTLPSLVFMDQLLFRMLWVGFIFLTATDASGIFFSQQIFGKPLVWNHKVVFSVVAWMIYGCLLAARYGWGIRGRKAAQWTLLGFLMLLMAFVGTKFVLEVVLHRV